MFEKIQKNFKNSIEIESFGFDSLNSGDFLKSSISILDDCLLFFEKKIQSLNHIERTNQNNNKQKTDTLPSSNLENEQIISNDYKIFISRIEEHKEIADKLKKFLEKIFPNKVNVFVANDPVSIPFSQDWFESIKDGIKKCNLMIILSTPESLKRPWINFEAGAANILNKQIGPICFNGQRPGSLPSPLNYVRPQAIDCHNDEDFNKHFENLIRLIAIEIGVSYPTVELVGSEFYQSIRSSHNGESSITLVIEKTRKYISDNDSVKLFDLVNSTRKKALLEISSDAFEIDSSKLIFRNIQIDENFVVKRFLDYERVIDPLCSICSTIAFFDDDKNRKLINSTMENLSFHHEWTNSRFNLRKIENYPLYLVNNSTGVIALKSNHYKMLASVILTPKLTESDGVRSFDKKPLVEELTIWNVLPDLSSKKFNFNPEDPNEKTTMWEHVLNHIFEQISDYIPDRISYLEELQKLRFLCAMVYIDLNFDSFHPNKITPFIREIIVADWVKGRRNIWGDYEKTDFKPIWDFVKDGEKNGDEWDLLNAGFFSGNKQRFIDCYTKFSSHVDFISK